MQADQSNVLPIDLYNIINNMCIALGSNNENYIEFEQTVSLRSLKKILIDIEKLMIEKLKESNEELTIELINALEKMKIPALVPVTQLEQKLFEILEKQYDESFRKIAKPVIIERVKQLIKIPLSKLKQELEKKDLDLIKEILINTISIPLTQAVDLYVLWLMNEPESPNNIRLLANIHCTKNIFNTLKQLGYKKIKKIKNINDINDIQPIS